MSAEITSERVCYVQCNFCNTILAVSVPCSSAIVAIVTVRCGHCSNLLSVNLGALLQSPPPPLVHHHLLQDHFQLQLQQKQQQYMNSNHHMPEAYLVNKDINNGSSSSSSSSFKADHFGPFRAQFPQQSKMPLPVRPPEKRQRVPSAYNRFIKEEIQRIKTSNPEISHREAFSMAAKNWAHFPHIHFGRKLESNKQAANKMNNVENGDHGSAHHQHKSLGLY